MSPQAPDGTHPGPRGGIALAAGNPMMTVVRATLGFEVVAFALSIPVMTKVSQLPGLTAALAGGGSALLCLFAAGTVRKVWGWGVAWLAQLAGIALGVLTPGMFVVGGLFAVLFVTTFVLGKRLEARGVTQSGETSG